MCKRRRRFKLSRFLRYTHSIFSLFLKVAILGVLAALYLFIMEATTLVMYNYTAISLMFGG